MSGSTDPWAAFRAAPPAADDPWAAFRAPAAPAAAPSVSQTVGGLGRRFGMGVRDVVEGVAGLPGAVYDATGAAINGLTGAVEAAGGPSLPRVNSASRNLGAVMDAAGLPAPVTEDERLVSAANRGVAGLVPTMGAGAALQAAGRAPAVASALLQAPVSQVAAGAAGGASGEVASQLGAGVGGQMVAGLAGGVAGAAGIAGARRLVSPVAPSLTPQQARLVEAADAQGIPLTPGQRTGSRPLRSMEAVFGEMPLTAGPQRAIDDAQRVAFNRAGLRPAGIEADHPTPDVLLAGRARIGGTIGSIAERNTLQVTPALDARLAQIDDNLQFALPEIAGPVRARIAQFRGMVQDGAVPGTAYRQMDSALGRTMRETGNGDLRGAIGELRTALRGAMDDSISPQDAEDWQRARRQYANLQVVTETMRPGADGVALGHIPPAGLSRAVAQSMGKDAHALGRGDLHDLGNIGQAFVKPSVPNSGTQQRTMMANILRGGIGGGGLGYATGGDMVTGAALGAGAMVLPRIAQALYNTDPVRRYLANQLTNPSQTTTINPGIVAALLADQERPR